MELFTLFALIVVISFSLAWLIKRRLGVKLFAPLPEYDKGWKNMLAAAIPAMLAAISLTLSYYINSLLWP